MHKPEPPRRWSVPWRDVTTPALEDDPADVGTAFGLELSIAPWVADEAPATHPPRPARTAAADDDGWDLRLQNVRRFV